MPTTKALSEVEAYRNFRAAFQGYISQAQKHLDTGKTAAMLIEFRTEPNFVLKEFLNQWKYRGKIFLKDRRGKNSYLLCGYKKHLVKLKKDKLLCSHHPKMGMITPMASSHTPLCKARSKLFNIAELNYSNSHSEFLIGGSLIKNIGTMESNLLVELLDAQLREPMDSYSSYKYMQAHCQKLYFIGGEYTCRLVKTLMKHEEQECEVICV